jgi:hypothetical protein
MYEGESVRHYLSMRSVHLTPNRWVWGGGVSLRTGDAPYLARSNSGDHCRYADSSGSLTMQTDGLS